MKCDQIGGRTRGRKRVPGKGSREGVPERVSGDPERETGKDSWKAFLEIELPERVFSYFKASIALINELMH